MYYNIRKGFSILQLRIGTRRMTIVGCGLRAVLTVVYHSSHALHWNYSASCSFQFPRFTNLRNSRSTVDGSLKHTHK